MAKIFNRPSLNTGKRVFFFCLIGLASVLMAQKLNVQQPYNQVFNPMHSFVNETEKPFRDELSLNGKWQCMPVSETNMSKFVKPETFQWDAVPLKVPSPWNVNSFSKGEGGDFLTFPSYPKSWERAQMGWMKKGFNEILVGVAKASLTDVPDPDQIRRNYSIG